MPNATDADAVAALPDKTPAAKQAAKKLAGERFRVLNTFIDRTMQELTPSERSVWLVLYRDTKPDGLARAGQVDIARRAGITDRQVRNAIAGLKHRRLLRVVRPGGPRRGVASYMVSPR